MRSFQCNIQLGKIFIRDPQQLSNKLRRIKRAGTHNLQLVTDFDHTLTKATYSENKQGDTTFKTVHTWQGTPEHIRSRCTELYLHYYPMESDPTIPHLEKKRLLKEWFE